LGYPARRASRVITLPGRSLLSFLESLPSVVNQLKEPGTKDMKFEDAVAAAEKATVLVLVY
jgi:hypothetical protein